MWVGRRSVSDFLAEVDTAKARKVNPIIGEKLRPGKRNWSQTWQWPPKTWDKDASCGARSGGGLPGHVAAEEQLFDIYCFVKDPRCFTMLEDILASQSMAIIISAIIDHVISEHTKSSAGF